MSDQPLNMEELREQIQKQLRLQRRITRITFLGASVFMFILFTAITVGITQATGNNYPDTPQIREILSRLAGGMFMLWIGWATGIIFHAFSILNEMGVFDRASKRVVLSRAVVDQVLAQMSTDEKVKRKPIEEAPSELRLTDDGELVPVEQPEQRTVSRQTRE